MAFKITFENPKLEKLVNRTKDVAVSAAKTARERTAGLGKLAGDRMARARLSRAVEDLQYEIDLQMQAVGCLIYATHKGRPSDSNEIQQILEYVDSLYEQMEGHEQQLKLMGVEPECVDCGEEDEEPFLCPEETAQSEEEAN